jgi:hypothetical protein
LDSARLKRIESNAVEPGDEQTVVRKLGDVRVVTRVGNAIDEVPSPRPVDEICHRAQHRARIAEKRFRGGEPIVKRENTRVTVLHEPSRKPSARGTVCDGKARDVACPQLAKNRVEVRPKAMPLLLLMDNRRARSRSADALGSPNEKRSGQ